LNDPKKSQPMTVDDLQSLYSDLRGSRSGPAIMDARAFFLERQMGESHAKLQEAYDKYRESRQRILRQDPEKQVDAKAKDRDHQVRRLKRKQEKAMEILETFEEYLRQLKRLADKEQDREDSKAKLEGEKAASRDLPPTEETSESSGGPAAPSLVHKDSIDEAMLEHFSTLIGDRQLDYVSSQFGFKPLQTIADVRADSVYLLRKGDKCLLIDAETVPDDETVLHLIDICNPKNQVKLSPGAMVDLSLKRKLVLLQWK
jgi:hypothetical protein